jgi:hypothetical protein
MSEVLNKTKTVRDVLEQILDNAVQFVHAARGVVYLPNLEADSADELQEFIVAGRAEYYGTQFATECFLSGERRLFGPEDMAARLSTRQPGIGRTSSVMMMPILQEPSAPELESIACFPLMTSVGKVLGVLELACPSKVLPEDLQLLDCFAVFGAVSLERGELEDIAKYGAVETELKQLITTRERALYEIPAKLRIPPEQLSGIFTVNFDAPQWAGTGLFKVVFAIYSRFNLLEEFKISAETCFRYLHGIISTYKKVPYHNCVHAIDVTQYCGYELLLCKLDGVIPKIEILALLVASVCHDANHDGFTNVYNTKAETPLGILFKNQSVMETHHCEVSIGVLSKAECNIFASLTP